LDDRSSGLVCENEEEGVDVQALALSERDEGGCGCGCGASREEWYTSTWILEEADRVLVENRHPDVNTEPRWSSGMGSIVGWALVFGPCPVDSRRDTSSVRLLEWDAVVGVLRWEKRE